YLIVTYVPFPYFALRSRTIILLLYFFLFRVFVPCACLPHGVFGYFIPTPDRPSPPPCGCESGCIAVPRTPGLQPIRRSRPAFPNFTVFHSMFPICPIVAIHVANTKRNSLDGN